MAERFSAATSGSFTPGANIPLPAEDETSSFLTPRAPYLSESGPAMSESPRDSFLQATPGTPNDSAMLLENKNEGYAPEDPDDRTATATAARNANTKRRTRRFLFLGVLGLIIVILAVILPIVFVVIKPGKHKSSSDFTKPPGSSSGSPTATGSSPTSSGSPHSAAVITGGDGSTVTANDGSTFTYSNSFGGIWYSDPNDPYNNSAFPNSWTPPLNQSWDFAQNRIYGVNLGGWFVLEPFIAPALYQKYNGAIDEWTLSEMMRADTSAGGGIGQIEDHYNTFITEQDIAQIAGAGLNWVRIPIPFWAIDTWGEEPFLAQVSWKYIVQALQWCRKYGIRVNLDLHTIPGSQNGFNHSGKDGQIDFLMGVMGMANAQRAMNYIRIITEFISQPEWKDVVPMFGIMNEALIKSIGDTTLRGFYVEVYEMIRGITGLGEGNGPVISIHDGFEGLPQWVGFMTGADRVALDTHPYFAFDGSTATAPIDTGTGAGAGGTWPQAACNRWQSELNASRSAFGITYAGEFSNGFNDCGLFLEGVGGQPTFGGNCDVWQDASGWDAGTKAGIQAFSEASMDALRDWFFWTWKVGNSSSGIVESPLWSYQLGLQGGWMPLDPRVAIGACGPSAGPIWDDTFESWQTGGASAGTIAPTLTVQYPWPPTDLQGTDVSLLPLYTSTGSISTLPAPTFTDTSGNSINAGDDGWFNPSDIQPGPTPIPGCDYPTDPWNAIDVPVPTATVCSGGASAAVPAIVTPPPSRR